MRHLNLGQITKKHDEYYTPAYAIYALVDYIRAFSRKLDHEVVIWCPFDTKDSYYVRIFKEKGFKVIHSHISEGKDFFDLSEDKEFVKGIDLIISNIPFSIKTEIFERLFELDIPFAVLTTTIGLFDHKKRWKLFKNNKFEIMWFSRRIRFFQTMGDESTLLNPPFTTSYVCHNFLERDNEFVEIERNPICLGD